jgi:CoA:oxalate CoA-transferase
MNTDSSKSSQGSGGQVAGMPLTGLKILALEHVVALPFGTQLLADLGAEVIGVEPTWFRNDEGSRWRLRTGRNKKRMIVNLKDRRGQEIVAALVKKFDIVAENYRPGVMKRYNLDYESLRWGNPQLIYASISGFGHDDILPSPNANRAAYGPIAEAAGGIMHTLFGQEPRRIASGIALGDITSALFAMIGILAAVRHRDRTGEGQYLDVAMTDCLLALNERSIVEYVGSVQGGGPNGRGIYMGGTYKAKDGVFVLFLYHSGHWESFCRLVEHPEWISDRRFSNFDDRQSHDRAMEEVVRPTLEHWASEMTKAGAASALSRVGLPASAVQTPEDIVGDGQFSDRRMLLKVKDERNESQTVVGNPIKLSSIERQPWPDYAISRPGDETAEVLRAELGMFDDEIAALSREGVIYVEDGRHKSEVNLSSRKCHSGRLEQC